MRQTLELYNGDTRLIRTTSPDTMIDLQSGNYDVTTELREQLSTIWPMEEYEGELILEVVNV
jgi:hypothetical protein